jgi:hypothetical protein
MKELANSLAQLAAIIMILITLAVSTAAIAQWASGGSNTAENAGTRPQQTLVVADAR